MKRVILFFALAISGLGLANAQWSSDPAENKQLLEESYWSTEFAMRSDGSFFILSVNPLEDINHVTPILFYFDKDGNKVWDEPIIFDIDSTLTWIKTNTQLMVDNEGNAIVVAQDLCGYQIEKYTAWKVNPQGEHMWSEDGVNLHGETGMPDADVNAALKMTQMPDGSYIFAWMGDGIMLQKVSSDGQLLWGKGKNIGSGAYPYVFDAGDGDIMVIYQTGGLEARRLDFEGNDVWPEPVSVFSGELNSQIPAWTYLKFTPTSDGVIAGYYGFEGTSAHYSMISYIKFDGTHAFPEADEGLRLGYSDNFGFSPAVAVDEENQAIYAVWQEYPGAQSIQRMVCQKISMDGELLWDSEGFELMPMESRPVSYQTVSIGPKGAILFGVMEQYDIDNNGLGANDPINVHAFLMNGNGEFVWDDTSKIVCNVPSVKYDLTCLPYANDQWIFLWEDCRVDGGVDGGHIFGQNIRLDGSMGTETANERVSQISQNLTITPNPVEEYARIQYDYNGNTTQGAQISLVNLNGATVATIYRGNVVPGRNIIEWSRPSGLASGMYIIRVQIGQEMVFVKIILR